MSNQGTQATSALQTTGNASLALIANNLGTLTPTTGLATAAGVAAVYNNQGTQATSAAQSSQTAILSLISNQEGTLATQATLSQIGGVLTAIMNNQGTQSSGADSIENGQLANIYNSQGTIQRIALFGTNGMPIDIIVDSRNDAHLGVAALQCVYASTDNSYSSNLTAGAVFYGTKESTLGIAGIQVMLKTDTNCTVTVEQSGIGTNWDIADS